jgi:hypothetical protein
MPCCVVLKRNFCLWTSAIYSTTQLLKIEIFKDLNRLDAISSRRQFKAKCSQFFKRGPGPRPTLMSGGKYVKKNATPTPPRAVANLYGASSYKGW